MHDHSEGARDHDHDHDGKDGPDRGVEDSLYKHIFIDRVRCLNESVAESGKTVIKPWDQRFDRTKYVESDSDQQLIVHIPFTGEVKLKSVCILGGPGESAPAQASLFINRDSLDFTSIEDTKADQEFALVTSIPEVGSVPSSSDRFPFLFSDLCLIYATFTPTLAREKHHGTGPKSPNSKTSDT